MNGMLPNHDVNLEIIKRQHHEAHAWAEARRLGGLSPSARRAIAEHERGARILAVVGPVAATVAATLILV